MIEIEALVDTYDGGAVGDHRGYRSTDLPDDDFFPLQQVDEKKSTWETVEDVEEQVQEAMIVRPGRTTPSPYDPLLWKEVEGLQREPTRPLQLDAPDGPVDVVLMEAFEGTPLMVEALQNPDEGELHEHDRVLEDLVRMLRKASGGTHYFLWLSWRARRGQRLSQVNIGREIVSLIHRSAIVTLADPMLGDEYEILDPLLAFLKPTYCMGRDTLCRRTAPDCSESTDQQGRQHEMVTYWLRDEVLDVTPLLKPTVASLLRAGCKYQSDIRRAFKSVPKAHYRDFRRACSRMRSTRSARAEGKVVGQATDLLLKALTWDHLDSDPRPAGDPVPSILEKVQEFKRGTYEPDPPKQKFIRKHDGGYREIWAYNLVDRIILGALYRRIERRTRQFLRPSCAGGVVGKGARWAVQEVQDEVAASPPGVAHRVVDIEKCFDSVDHLELALALQKVLPSYWVTRLISALGVKSDVGLPQGNPLSCLLLNLFLSFQLDRYVDHQVFYMRYVDDIVIIGEPENVAWGYETIEARLRRLRMLLKASKTSAKGKALPVTYLGFDIHPDRVLASEKTVERIQAARAEEMREEQVKGCEIYYSQFLHQSDWHRQIHAPLRNISISRSLGTEDVDCPTSPSSGSDTMRCVPLQPRRRRPHLGAPPCGPGAVVYEYYSPNWRTFDIGLKSEEREGTLVPVVDENGDYIEEGLPLTRG